MDHATLLVLLALLQYVWFTARVGLARGKYNVNAPACDGDESWNRLFRVQQNTLEQLVIFIPATYAFAYYLSELWVLIPGLAFLVGSAILVPAHLTSGILDDVTLPFSLAMCLPVVVGMWVGLRYQDRMDQALFRKIALGVLCIAGLNLLRRGLM